MTTYRVEFEVEVPDEVPEEELRAFMRFWLGEVCSWQPMPGSPLAKLDLRGLNARDVYVCRRSW